LDVWVKIQGFLAALPTYRRNPGKIWPAASKKIRGILVSSEPYILVGFQGSCSSVFRISEWRRKRQSPTPNMIHVIEQNTVTVAVNDQTRLNKREISGVDRKGLRSKKQVNSMLNKHLEWETSKV
jgi:hypothetical protein